MCYVTATELKNNLSFYLSKSLEEDVYVTKNGQVIACLTNPQFKALIELEEMMSKEKATPIKETDDDALFLELSKKYLK